MPLDQAGFLKRRVSSVLVDRLERLGAGLNPNILVEFWNPDPLRMKVRRDLAFDCLRYVTANAAFFLGQTRTVDSTSNPNFGTADAAYFSHRS